MPTWVCRVDGPEGEFLRGANIHKHWVTSSGYMNCVSAGGKLLGGRPSEKILEEFRKLPEAERKPGAVQVPDLAQSEMVIPSPPLGGLVLRVHGRFMTRDDNGELRYSKATDFPLLVENPKRIPTWQLFLHPNTEYLWLTKEEWQSFVPDNPVKGAKLAVSPVISERMARFHLYPRRTITSEGMGLSKRSIKEADLALIVEDVSPQKIRMKLEGLIHIGSDFDQAKATTPNGPLSFGFETPIHGILEFDRKKNAFTRFDIVAPGDVWGRWGDANNNSLPVERPGRTPFVYAFELATGDSPSDRIPPGGNGNWISPRTGYFPEIK